jgi:chloramphenicol O-acetyltransferase
MTKKRIEELRQRFQNNEGTIQDLGEIMIDFFISSSEHIKDAKKQILEVKDEQEKIYTELKKSNNPVYTIIEGSEEDFGELFDEEEEQELAADVN